jgi:hypothetical protein
MKVLFSLFISIITLLFIVMTSCNKLAKDANDTKITMNMVDTILPTDTFTYTLPDNQSDDPYQITSQASHFKKSELSTDANGKTVYTYIYSATNENPLTDDVTIANVEEVHGAKTPGANPSHNHHCKGKTAEIERTIHIHFVIR